MRCLSLLLRFGLHHVGYTLQMGSNELELLSAVHQRGKRSEEFSGQCDQCDAQRLSARGGSALVQRG